MTMVRAMILAAGEGRRLRPLTETTPKALVEVGGRPLIDYSITTLKRAGITELVVNLHWLGEQIRDYLGDGSGHGVSVEYSEEDPLQDSGGGIAQARPLLGDDTFVTVNADTIVDVDVGRVLAFHREHAAVATMVLRKDPRMDDFGTIAIDGDGRIGRFLAHHRPALDEVACERLDPYMYTGVQVLEPAIFEYMDASEPFSLTRETYPRLLAADEPLFGYRFDGAWITVGTPDQLKSAGERLRNTPLDRPEGERLS